MVVNKPAGMVSLASSFLPETPTVAGALAWKYGEEQPFHIVNRLDKGTTGLLIVAKCGYVHNLLRERLHSGQFYREYRGICHGCPEGLAGTSLTCPSGGTRAPGSREEFGRMALPPLPITMAPPTASAMSSLEADAGDGAYAPTPASSVRHRPPAGRRLALWQGGTCTHHAARAPLLCTLHLLHPVTGEALNLTAPLPEDMTRLDRSIN